MAGGISMASVSYNWNVLASPSFVNDQITAGDQRNAAIGANSSGQFFVTWDEDANDPVDGRVYRADGSAIGSQFFVNSTTANQQRDASVAALGNGNFVVGFT